MRIARQIVVFDAADLTAESIFWAGLLGGTVDAESLRGDTWRRRCGSGSQEHQVSYIDATGNLRVAVERPALYLREAGSDRGPWRGLADLAPLSTVQPPLAGAKTTASSGTTRSTPTCSPEA